MSNLQVIIEQINHFIHSIVWGPCMLIAFLLCGILYTIRLRFFQFSKFKLWIENTLLACITDKSVTKHSKDKGLSQFQALTTSLAATLGTGNIAGTATAIALGGPGAVFWMWLSALVGMMTGYAEKTLGTLYRYKDKDGEYVGGAMVYMERGLKSKSLARIFCICLIIASFGMGNMAQANAVSMAMSDNFSIKPVYSGIILTIICAMVILKDMKGLAAFTEKIVPFMSIIYISGTLVIIFCNMGNLLDVLKDICKEAFNFKASLGGVSGYGIMLAARTGISRGVFSNEAGLGSSVMVHSQANVSEPAISGMWGIFEVFVDTIVMCTLTALSILMSGVYNKESYIEYYINGSSTILSYDVPNGVTLTSNSFGTIFGTFGNSFVSISIILFAFSTIIGWSVYGTRACKYIFGEGFIKVYKLIYIGFIYVGCVMSLTFVFDISDTFNGLMAIPNLIALFILSPKVIAYTKDYLKRKA